MATTEIEIHVPQHADEDRHTIVDDKIVFVSVKHDDHMPNPLKDDYAMGGIYSLGRRHGNYDPDKIEDAVRNNPDHVKLSYYKHGNCLWFVKDSKAPTGVEFQWDGVRFAGVWVPDKNVLENCEFAEGTPERMKWMQEYAANICETYTQWCNGEIYCYSVAVYKLRNDEDGEPYELRDDYRRDKPLYEEDCGGMYGWNYALSEAKEAAESGLEEKTK